MMDNKHETPDSTPETAAIYLVQLAISGYILDGVASEIEQALERIYSELETRRQVLLSAMSQGDSAPTASGNAELRWQYAPLDPDLSHDWIVYRGEFKRVDTEHEAQIEADRLNTGSETTE